MSGYFRNIIPSMITMLFMSIYTTVDGLFVGRVVSTDAMAAINISYPIMNVMFTLAFGLASGGSIRIAKALGEEKQEEAGKRFTAVLIMGMAAGVIFICVIGPCIIPVLRFLGATDRLLHYCLMYGGIVLISYPAGILKEILTYVLRIQGMPGISMGLSIAGGVANIILDYLCIVIFDWGVAGAAAATSAGMFLTVLGDIFFLLKRGTLRPERPGSYLPKEMLKILRLSVPGGILELSYAVTVWFFNQMSLSFYQEKGVAAYTVIGYIQYALSAIFIGLGNGVSPMLSYYCGAGKRKENTQILKKSAVTVLLGGVLLCVCGYYGAGFLTGIFLEKGTLPFMLARRGNEWISLSCLFMGSNILLASALNAYGDSRKASALTFLRTVLFPVVGSCVLTKWIGYEGMLAAYVFAEVLVLLLSLKEGKEMYGIGITKEIDQDIY